MPKDTFKCGSLYIDSEDQVKKKKTTINSKNVDDKFFQHGGSYCLNYLHSFRTEDKL